MKTYKEKNERLYDLFTSYNYSEFKFCFNQLSPNGVLLFIEYLKENDKKWIELLDRITKEVFRFN